VHQRRLCLEQRSEKPAARLQLERPVVPDARDGEADFVQVRDEYDDRVALADAHPQVARRIGLGLRPGRQQPLHRLAHRPLGAGDAVGLDERSQDRLRLGHTCAVLRPQRAP